jgi:hypothetical protein
MKLAEKKKAYKLQAQEGIQSVLSRMNAGSIVSNSMGSEDDSPPAKQEVSNEPISECLRKYYQFNFMGDKGNWTGTSRNMRRFKKVVQYMVKAAELANYTNLPFLSEVKPNLYCRDENGLWIVNPLYESWEDKLQTVAFEIQIITKALLVKKETQKNEINDVQQKSKAETGSLVNTLYAVDFRITALDSKKEKITSAKESSNNKSSAKNGRKRKAELNTVELVGDKGKKSKSVINAEGDSAVKKKGNNTQVTINNYFTSSKTSSSSD